MTGDETTVPVVCSEAALKENRKRGYFYVPSSFVFFYFFNIYIYILRALYVLLLFEAFIVGRTYIIVKRTVSSSLARGGNVSYLFVVVKCVHSTHTHTHVVYVFAVCF